MAMCANNPSITAFGSLGADVDHQALLERAAALGGAGTPRNSASGTASEHSNELVLNALSDGATVRIRVTDEIATTRSTGTAETRRDRTVAISRLDAKGERDRFLFSGTIIEFEILDGDVEVTLNDEAVDPVTLDLPNEIVLKPLTETAEVRIKVSGAIAADRVPGDTEMLCDGHALSCRLDADDAPSTFRFSGDVVEFKLVRGDVEVTCTVAARDA